MATITPRRVNGKVRYQATVRRKGYPSRSKTCAHKRDAERWAHSIEIEMDKGSYADRREGHETTLRKALQRYEREVTPHKKGWKAEGSRISFICNNAPFINKGVALVTATDLANWRDLRLRERAPNTVRNDLVVLSAFYQHAIKEWRIVDHNPVQAIKWPSPGKSRKRRYRDGEEEALLKHASAAEAAFLTLLTETGMRLGEALNLTADTVNYRERYIHLSDTKNGEERFVPITTKLEKALKGCPIDLHTRRLFPWRGRSAWHYAFKKLKKAAGVEGLRTHDLRHEGVSRLQEMGLDTFEIMAISGHKTYAMVARYTHPKVERLAQKMDAAAGAQGS